MIKYVSAFAEAVQKESTISSHINQRNYAQSNRAGTTRETFVSQQSISRPYLLSDRKFFRGRPHQRSYQDDFVSSFILKRPIKLENTRSYQAQKDRPAANLKPNVGDREHLVSHHDSHKPTSDEGQHGNHFVKQTTGATKDRLSRSFVASSDSVNDQLEPAVDMSKTKMTSFSAQVIKEPTNCSQVRKKRQVTLHGETLGKDSDILLLLHATFTVYVLMQI